MVATLSSPSGIFTLTKTKVLVMASLAITWWFASILPHYKPMLQAELKSRLDEARQKIPTIKVDWHPNAEPRSTYNASKLALIIEPRPLPHLVPQMLHMISVVPPDWRFLFIGSNLSVISVGRSLPVRHQQVIGKLDLMVLPEPWEIDSKEHVFRLLTDVRFYDEFLPDVEHILKYESDSILCANSGKSLDEWLEWSWVGAPRTADDRFAGNGGLSLRRVSAIKRILRFQARYNDTQAEDEWFGTRLWVLKGEKVASAADGGLAVEDSYFENPMGFHVRDGGRSINDHVWKDKAQRKKIFDYCPELSLIMDMKLERERCPGDDKEGTIHPTEEEQEEERRKLQEEAAKKKAEEDAARLKAEEEAGKLLEEEEKKKAAMSPGVATPGGDAEITATLVGFTIETVTPEAHPEVTALVAAHSPAAADGPLLVTKKVP